MDDRSAMLPVLARLVSAQAKPMDLATELAVQLGQGRRRVTLGLGPSVDLPLLDDELVSAEIALRDREVVIAAIRLDAEGYAVERPATNFGVYVRRAAGWRSVPQAGEERGLRPGDEVGFGSTPAEAVKLSLPDGPWIPHPTYRSARHQVAAQRPSNPPETPPTLGPRLKWPSMLGTPMSVDRTTTPITPPTHGGPRVGAPSTELEPRFAHALRHWRYAMVTFGGDPRAVLFLEDDALKRLRAALGRNLDTPERGYELFVKDPDPDLWVQPPGEPAQAMKKGQVVRLRGPGNVIGFGRYAVTLPAPGPVSACFGQPGHTPTRAEVANVLELAVGDLRDEDRVKSRYRELARRFHPDRTSGDPGHTSRFVEIQHAFDAWKAGLSR